MITLLLLILRCLNVNCLQTFYLAQEQRLMNDLLADYDPLIRPIFNHQLAMNISVSIEITQAIEISEKEDKCPQFEEIEWH